MLSTEIYPVSRSRAKIVNEIGLSANYGEQKLWN